MEANPAHTAIPLVLMKLKTHGREEAASVILGPGEGHAHYTARGSEMFFKAVAGLDDGDL